jgi:hypothetical protein
VIRAVNKTSAGTIAGVINDADGNHLSGVSVSIMLDELVTSQTEEDGSYALSGISAGVYSVTAEKENFTSVTIDKVEVVAGNKTLQNFVLEEPEVQAD